MKVLFLTDAHLGSGSDTLQREQELCQLLDKMKGDIDVLILLGDLFDFWFSYRQVVPRGHTRFLGKLAELSDLGIEIHFFIGNHDMWIFDYLEKEMNVIMHDEPTMMEFDGKKLLIGHGDGLGHLDHRYDFLKKVFRCRLNQILFAMLPSSFTFGIANRWSNHSRHSHNPEVFQYLGDEREGIVLWCKEQLEKEPYDYCVFGHRHTPLQRTITATNGNTSTYINVGDWIVNRNYALLDNGKLTLYNLKENSSK